MEFGLDLSHSETGSLQTHPVGNFPNSRMHDCNRHAQKLAEYPLWFPDLWNKGYHFRESQVEGRH